MNNLFDDGRLSAINKKYDIKIVSKSKEKPLSKKQIQFNRLSSIIENLEKEIEKETTKYNELLEKFLKEVHPFYEKHAETIMNLAYAVARNAEQFKFGKNQMKEIKETIQLLCEEAFDTITPTQEQIDFYDKWSDITYKHLEELNNEEANEDFAEYMKDMFDIDIDPSTFADVEKDPEKFVEFKNDINQKIQEKLFGKEENKKKTKKELEKEQKSKLEDNIKLKNIRSIYIALAKVLHPDTETDENQKREKEEVMKKVITAYNNKDLTTLLKLELEWLSKENNHLSKLTDDKLNIYIKVLKEQEDQLRQEFYQIRMNPRYQSILKFAMFPHKIAIKRINDFSKQIKNKDKQMKMIAVELSQQNDKKYLYEFVTTFNESYAEKEFLDMLYRDDIF